MKAIKRIFKWALIVIPLLLLGWFEFAYWTSTNNCERLAAVPANPIKAITYCDFGTADVLKLQDIEKPVPNDDQVLIKVRAASVNPYDWHFMRGTPYLMRIEAGLRKPKNTRLGGDLAGEVEAVGKNVTELKPGDEVFGVGSGSFAQYALSRPKRLATKPANITSEQAAAVPVAGITALQALRDTGKIQPGQKVLINGASGGVGTFAVQIAKSFGADVTGVCSTRNVEMVRGLGADHVIDYTKDDFAKSGEHYDLIVDNVPNHSLSECRGLLTPKGKYIMIGGGGPNDGNWIGPFGRVIHALLMKPFVHQEMRMMVAEINTPDLTALGDLMRAGKVTPVVDRKYKLDQVPDAIRYLEEGHARGKVLVTMD